MPRKKFNLREEREAVRGARPWNDAILNPVILTREEAELEAARSKRGRKRQRACASGGAAEQSKRMRVRAETSGDGAGDGASPATRDDGQAGGSELDGRKSIPDVGRAPKSTSPPVLPAASSSSVSADKNKTLLKVLALQKAQRAASATGSSEGGRRRRRLKRSRAPNPHREGAPASKNQHGVAAAVRPRLSSSSASASSSSSSQAAAPPPPALPQAHLSWHPGPPLRKWNITSLFSEFLFLGAGMDENGRCLPFFRGESPALHAEKQQFFCEHNVRFVLNMARGATELRDMSYPVNKGSIRAQSLSMNDVDAFTPDMARMFDTAAAFIEEACVLHLKMKARVQHAKANGLPPPKRPVSIFVHCVAGVHRSAMAVVWWMVKFRGWNLREAWSTVRETRDTACKWTNVTLGGSPDTGRKSNWFTGCWNVLVKEKLTP